MSYNVTGTAGSDALNQSGGTGPGTIVGLAGFGGDTIASSSGADLIFANESGDAVSAGARSQNRLQTKKIDYLCEYFHPGLTITVRNFFSLYCNAV
jgi:hypothetical protein